MVQNFVQTNDFLQKELFDRLTGCKQMTDV